MLPLITVACLSVGNKYRNQTALGRQSHINFSQHRHFSYIDEQTHDPSRPIPWSKIPLIHNHLPKISTEFLLYLDADTLITNPNFDFTPYVSKLNQEKTDLLLVRDRMALNTGVMLIRNSSKVLDLFQRVWNHTEFINHKWWEQAALIKEHSKNKESKRLISIVPKAEHGLLNPTVKKHWSKESFLIHFAGLPHNILPRLFKRQLQLL